MNGSFTEEDKCYFVKFFDVLRLVACFGGCSVRFPWDASCSGSEACEVAELEISNSQALCHCHCGYWFETVRAFSPCTYQYMCCRPLLESHFVYLMDKTVYVSKHLILVTFENSIIPDLGK